MATNVWPKFTGSGWYNEGIDISFSDDYAIFFSSSSTSKGLYYLIPDEWKGKYVTIGCAGFGGGRICIRDASYNDLVSPITNTTETKFLLPSTAKYMYLLISEGSFDFYMDAVYLYLDGDSGGGDSGGGTGETQVVTLKPTSASGSNWTNPSYLYDSSTSTGAEVSVTYSNYGSRVLTCNFDTSSIPSNATITSATLEVAYAQSSSTSTRRYTPYFDINGDSSKRVLSKQLTSVSIYEETVDITNHMSSLKTITITPYRAGTSGSNTLTVFDMKIIVNYQMSPTSPTIKNVFLGSTKITDIYLGTTKISKVYLGTSVIFEK